MVPSSARLVRRASFPLALAIIALLLAASTCDGGGYDGPGVIIEPLTPTRTDAVRASANITTATPDPAAPEATATAEPEPPAPAAPVEPTVPPRSAVNTSSPPSEGRWIEVDVTNLVVRLMDGTDVVREIAPVAVGEEIDTGNYLSTQTGLFHVYSKIEPLSYNAPFDTYISHWVGFDPALDNGFHSFLKDETGAVVDASTGRVSNGCVRTGEADAAAIYAFAEIGMPVWVHV